MKVDKDDHRVSGRINFDNENSKEYCGTSKRNTSKYSPHNTNSSYNKESCKPLCSRTGNVNAIGGKQNITRMNSSYDCDKRKSSTTSIEGHGSFRRSQSDSKTLLSNSSSENVNPLMSDSSTCIMSVEQSKVSAMNEGGRIHKSSRKHDQLIKCPHCKTSFELNKLKEHKIKVMPSRKITSTSASANADRPPWIDVWAYNKTVTFDKETKNEPSKDYLQKVMKTQLESQTSGTRNSGTRKRATSKNRERFNSLDNMRLNNAISNTSLKMNKNHTEMNNMARSMAYCTCESDEEEIFNRQTDHTNHRQKDAQVYIPHSSDVGEFWDPKRTASYLLSCIDDLNKDKKLALKEIIATNSKTGYLSNSASTNRGNKESRRRSHDLCAASSISGEISSRSRLKMDSKSPGERKERHLRHTSENYGSDIVLTTKMKADRMSRGLPSEIQPGEDVTKYLNWKRSNI